MPSPPSRLLHLDALKALAAQLIVLHHLAAYGPIAETLETLWPALMAWLYNEARMAVQVFLVLGGFLAARGLAPLPGLRPLLQRLLQRWQRLALPFIAAVLLVLGVSALVAPWLPELVPATVSAAQLLAHALLLQGVLGHESLTVGAWYVAIDLQLHALLLLLAWLSQRLARPGLPGLVLLLVCASLWVFNRDAGLDNWAIYFFGAYGLGALVHWAGANRRPRLALAGLAAVVLIALLLDWRARIALAGATALLLAWLQARHDGGRPLLAPQGRAARGLAELGNQSYALFLIHFPVLLLVNALFDHKDPEHPLAALAAFVAAWLLSNAAALLFHRWVELPSARLGLASLRLRGA